MGVLTCNRNGCDNIMCDRYSHRYGYICNDCFEELVNSNINIETFMKSTRKEEYKDLIGERERQMQAEFCLNERR